MKAIENNANGKLLWTSKDDELLSFELASSSEQMLKVSEDTYSLRFYDFDLNLKYFLKAEASKFKPDDKLLFKKPKLDWEEPSESVFKDDFDSLMNSFSDGEATKAVPVCFSKSNKELSEDEMMYLEANWRENRASSYPVFLDSPDFKYIGLSPELLFERIGQSVNTMALAGTRKLDETFSEEEFLNNKKEREEHQIVIDSICEVLGDLGALAISETYVYKLKKLAHLRTDIKLELEDTCSNSQLVEILHPTPALGVYPRKSLSKWFSEHNEKQNRSLFGAPILIEKGNWARCVVGIRCLFWEANQWKLGSGCGIVSGSEFSSEWSELASKRNSVLSKLGLK